MPQDLAKETGVTAMAVSKFLASGAATEIIEYNKGEPPRRILDYVPPSWIELVKLPAVEEEAGTLQVKLDTAAESQKEVQKNR